MSDETVLADRVVALGVGCSNGHFYGIGDTAIDLAKTFVRDWRVAGALLEMVAACPTDPLISIEGGKAYLISIFDCYSDINCERNNDCLPTAIIQACVEALEAK